MLQLLVVTYMLSTTSVLFSQNTGTLSLTKGAVSHEGLVIKLIQRAEVIVRLALIAGDGRGQGSEAAQHHQDTQIQLHGSLYGVICVKLYSLPACCNISLLTAWAALVALTLRDLASTMGVLLVQYSFCKHSCQVVPLPVSLKLEEILMVSKTPTLHHHPLHHLSQTVHIPKAQVDPLTSKWMNPVCSIPHQDSPRPNIPAGITKNPEGKLPCSQPLK